MTDKSYYRALFFTNGMILGVALCQIAGCVL